MSFVNRIALLIQITVVGTILVFSVVFIYYQRAWFVPWKSLGIPPEKAVKILSVGDGLWVETISGAIYQYKQDKYAGQFQCKDNCWELSEIPESDIDTTWSECDNPSPIFINPVDKKTVCYWWAPGYDIYAYVINRKGTVFVWSQSKDEGMWLLVAPLYGFLISFLVALIIVGSKANNDIGKSE